MIGTNLPALPEAMRATYHTIATVARVRHCVIVAHPGMAVTMIVRRIASAWDPPHGAADRWRVGLIHWLASWGDPTRVPTGAPFRAPHHTVSTGGLLGSRVGRERRPHPGECTLAHGGILYLDELAEFTRGCLEGLHEALDARQIAVWRNHETTLWPARFRLIAATMPCPCGYLNHAERACMCPPVAVKRYRERWAKLARRSDVEVIDLTAPACSQGESPAGPGGDA